MSVLDEAKRIAAAKADIREASEGRGVPIPDSAHIDEFPDYVNKISSISGAACGKFTWDGNFPVYCDCSSMPAAPTNFLLYSTYFVNLGTEEQDSIIAAKGVGTSISSAVLRVTAKNSASVSAAQSGIVYDSENKAIKLVSNLAGNLMSGQDYYWIAV